MRALVVDANGLLMPFQFRLNLDTEIARLLGEVPVLVPESVLGELERLGTKEAKAALALARKYEVVSTELCGDDAVIDVAERHSGAVLTNDRELIERLKKRAIPVLRLRSGHFLVLTGCTSD
ncbi:MAG: twitching motility protein PilT [Candidatus Thermoplasmatota archaeon]|nr:twitching motility protein PilT [Candidatus Thermoplasmatota archaeon]